MQKVNQKGFSQFVLLAGLVVGLGVAFYAANFARTTLTPKADENYTVPQQIFQTDSPIPSSTPIATPRAGMPAHLNIASDSVCDEKNPGKQKISVYWNNTTAFSHIVALQLVNAKGQNTGSVGYSSCINDKSHAIRYTFPISYDSTALYRAYVIEYEEYGCKSVGAGFAAGDTVVENATCGVTTIPTVDDTIGGEN